MQAYEVVVAVGAIAAGMMAGLLLVFSTTVMPALNTLAPKDGLRTMQIINRRITEPLFGLGFVGGLGASVVAIVFSIGDLGDRLLGFAAGVIYLVGFFGVTATVHLPINADLDAADPAVEADLEAWPSSAARWRRFNHLRAAAAFVACVLFVLALVRSA